MLIETPYKVGDVITIKLTSGEELVEALGDAAVNAMESRTPR